MKNITVSVDEDVILAVRLYAAERSSTVEALVREFLTELANRKDRTRKARRRIVELSERSKDRTRKARRRILEPSERSKARTRKARRRIVELSERSTARIGSHAWTREDLHER